MSLYREAGRHSSRNVAIAAIVALVVGLGLGFALGRSTAPEPSAADVVAHVHSQLQPVADGLELIPNEYAQAYRGEGVESKGVQGALDRVQAGIADAKADLEQLNPSAARALEANIAVLATGIRTKAPPADIKRAAEQAQESLRAVPGGR